MTTTNWTMNLSLRKLKRIYFRSVSKLIKWDKILDRYDSEPSYLGGLVIRSRKDILKIRNNWSSNVMDTSSELERRGVWLGRRTD